MRKLTANGWFIPMAYTVVTLLIATIVPRLEHRFLPELVSSMSAPSAMSVCSAIASGMIALTGIVFSLTFLMVQFSATAYSPRLVLWIARDPIMSHALGVFISTFLYALMMLAWVDRGAMGKVPFVSTWMVFILLLASMGMFIALIERVALLQINRMLIFTADRGRQSIEQLYMSAPDISTTAAGIGGTPRGTVIQTVAHVGRPGVIQALQIDALVETAQKSAAVIEVTVAVGDGIVEMTPLLRVYEAAKPLDEVALRAAIEIGQERTFEQDPKYALRLIVDIAIKALSPAINDPTTAVQALDQIEDLLLRLGRQSLEIGAFHDREGKLRVIVPFPTWDDFLSLALGEIRHYGADSVQVMRRMKALIKNLTVVLSPGRHAALHDWERRLQGSITRTFVEVEERAAASVADRQGIGLGETASAAKAEKTVETISKLHLPLLPFFLAGLLLSTFAAAAELSPTNGAESTNPSSKFHSEEDGWLDISGFLDEKYGFLPIVMPITEPPVGYGAVGALAFISSPLGGAEAGYGRPNITIVGGMGTANGTWGAVAGDVRYWLDDRLQTVAGIIYTSVNLDFYGIGQDNILTERPLRYNLEPKGGMLQGKYRLGGSRLWAGLSYAFASTDVRFKAGEGTPGLPEFQSQSNVGGLTPSLTYDSRDNIFTPNHGTYLEFSGGLFSKALGGDDEFQRINLLAMQFMPLCRNLYLGIRGRAAASFGDEPFYLRPFVTLRGAPIMRYQGEEVAEIETELRWQFWKRFSLIGFVGGGSTWNDFTRFNSSQTLVTGGGGFRYELARKYGIHAGLDVAFGPDNNAIYIQIGSAWARP